MDEINKGLVGIKRDGGRRTVVSVEKEETEK